ncbi:hypothetical protein [Nocardia sp. NPDC052566]|uniref:hypothetical protein n=1 Tax=Nocardia sp. NPDC052566 TaxID=3364330 RepID=UPI0037C65DCC
MGIQLIERARNATNSVEYDQDLLEFADGHASSRASAQKLRRQAITAIATRLHVRKVTRRVATRHAESISDDSRCAAGNDQSYYSFDKSSFLNHISINQAAHQWLSRPESARGGPRMSITRPFSRTFGTGAPTATNALEPVNIVHRVGLSSFSDLDAPDGPLGTADMRH